MTANDDAEPGPGDVTAIRGIGRAKARILDDQLGIVTLADLASTPVARLTQAFEAAGRPSPQASIEDWLTQARALLPPATPDRGAVVSLTIDQVTARWGDGHRTTLHPGDDATPVVGSGGGMVGFEVVMLRDSGEGRDAAGSGARVDVVVTSFGADRHRLSGRCSAPTGGRHTIVLDGPVLPPGGYRLDCIATLPTSPPVLAHLGLPQFLVT